MSSIRFVFFLLVGCLSGESAFCQQIKRVVGICKDERGTTTMIEKEYSRNGYLLKDNEPYIYVFRDYKYDEEGRLKESEQVFGESSANGFTTYNYSENKSCSRKIAAMYVRSICDSFNVEGNLIYRYSEYIGDEEVRWNRSSVIQYFYNSNGLRVKEVETELRYVDSTRKDATVGINTYYYNEFDSLTEVYKVDMKKKDTSEKTLIKYDPNTHLKIEEVQYKGGDINYSYIFKYDADKRLVAKSVKDFNIEQYTFYYKNKWLMKSLRTSESEEGSVREYTIYENGNIPKTVGYLNGKKVQTVKYVYTYW